MRGEKEFSCGLGRWRPEWVQKLATMRWFMVVYGFLGTVQGTTYVYFVATLTTMEKRFQIRSELAVLQVHLLFLDVSQAFYRVWRKRLKSKIWECLPREYYKILPSYIENRFFRMKSEYQYSTLRRILAGVPQGILMAGNEISQIFLSLFLAYFGGKGNKPLWIAWGIFCSSMACFVFALPHFVYGPGPNALALTEEFFDHRVFNASSPSSEDENPMVCSSSRDPSDGKECKQENTEQHLLSLCLIFFSQFALGIGSTLYTTLGQPYLDDNSKKKNTPKLLGLVVALRMVGPAMGFVLGFLCLRFYIVPSAVPVIERTDPRWLGAWWLGWLILGTVLAVLSFLIAMFPRQLRPTEEKSDPNGERSSLNDSEPTRRVDGSEVQPTTSVFLLENERQDEVGIFTDFRNAMKRVCGNLLLMSNAFGAVFYILGASGFINFFSKYAEAQFQQSAAVSSMTAAVSVIGSMVIGFIISGYLISKFRPKERNLLLFNAIIPLLYIATDVVFMFFGCTEDTLQGSVTESGSFDPNLECNANCSCEFINYSPVCFVKGKQTFFSACHAGCKEIQESSQVKYTNCTCLPDPTDSVNIGPCKVNCTLSFVAFIIIKCIVLMVGSSAKITNILISYRCVEPRDKPLAQAINMFMTSLLAFIPGPIIYGKVIDSTCQIWDEKCGKRGNCWVYDKLAFRTYLNTTELCFSIGTFIFDVIIYFLGKNIKLYEEPTNKRKT